jgi:hypothetical protein
LAAAIAVVAAAVVLHRRRKSEQQRLQLSATSAARARTGRKNGAGSVGPNGLKRLPGGNPGGTPCPAIARTGRCPKATACSFSHALAWTLEGTGAVGGARAVTVPTTKTTTTTRTRKSEARPNVMGGGVSAFYSKKVGGLLPMSLRLVDTFLRWDCGQRLLGLGLFPDAKEISESMGCFQACLEELGGVLGPKDGDCVAVVVGDGRTPRTAALLAHRTRYTNALHSSTWQPLKGRGLACSTSKAGDTLPSAEHIF